MRYWYDTEFIDDGKTIDLISIGIVCEDGREYYAQSVEFDHRKASKWVKENVLVHLVTCTHTEHYRRHEIAGLYRADRAYHKRYGGQCVDQQRGLIHDCPWRTREQIAHDIKIFFNPSNDIELWGYYSAYDHVAFAQIFGTMMDLPKGYPMYTRDIQQWCDMLDYPPLPGQKENEHHALADARWNKLAWEFLKTLEAGRQ